MEHVGNKFMFINKYKDKIKMTRERHQTHVKITPNVYLILTFVLRYSFNI